MVGKENSSIRNSYELFEDIKNFKNPKAHKLMSFDVKSLFTNVPTSKLVNTIISMRWRTVIYKVP